MIISGSSAGAGGRLAKPSKICPVCSEDYSADFETQVLRSTLCGHIVCSRCLARKGRHPNGTRPEDGECLICHVRPAASDTPAAATASAVYWNDVSQEENWFERESVVRAKVLDILCADRSSFKTTPLYNTFLEEREEIIYEMAFSDDPKVRQDRTEFLKQYEIEHQSQTLQAFERLKRKREDFIRDIVAKEGTFYELVKQDPSSHQFSSSRTAAAIRAGKIAAPHHPLERLHPELFGEIDTNGSGLGGMAPGGPAGTSGKKDPTAGGSIVGSAKGSAFLADLYSNLPPTLLPNVQWHQIKKQNKDFKLAADAGGHLKEAVNRRTMQELFNGIRYD